MSKSILMINYTEYYTNKVNNDEYIDNKTSKHIAQSEMKIPSRIPIKQDKNPHMSFAQPSENINFIASNVNDNVDKDISKEFDTLMSKICKRTLYVTSIKK